jgi:epoxide hydrolase-like predicted phosphatase
MDIHALIWDLGGVLVRTEDHSSRQKLADRFGLTRFELEELVFNSESGTKAQLGQISADQHWKDITRPFQLTLPEIIEFQEFFWGGDRLDETLVDTIRSLRLQYKTALLSNAFSDLREMIFQQWKINDAFDEIVISSEVGVMKPDASIYKQILEQLSVRPEQAIFIDDFPQNIRGARQLNLKTIHFRSTEQTLEELERYLQDKTP